MPSKPTLDMDRIRQLATAGCTQKQVCQRLGISKSAACRAFKLVNGGKA